MTSGPVYELGHLIVAAIRVISHRESRPPTLGEIGTLLGLSPEFVGQVIRGLEEKNIVRTVESAFDDRFEIVEHTHLEELPREMKMPGMEQDIEDFEKRFREKQEKLENLFESDEIDGKKKEKMKNMEDELKSFKKKPIESPFFEDAEDADDTEN